MQFSRQIFYDPNTAGDGIQDIGTVKVHANFTNFVKEHGFVNLDGSEISGVEAVNTFRWRYDTESIKHKSYWRKGNTGYYGAFWSYYYYTGTNNVSSRPCFICDNGAQTNYPHCIFFIPTKNNGFFTVMYDFYHYYGGVVTTPTLKSFSKIDTPQISDPNGRNYGVILCFFNNVTNEWNYFNTNLGQDTNIFLDDRGDSGGINVLSYATDATGDKTDVKQGVCTLIKPPYNNGFLSNIYIVSTSPTQGSNDANGTDNKFFSFNGRNFYGFWRNMVVELPSELPIN